MKKVILMMSMIFMNTVGFAQSSLPNKNSALLNALSSAWKAKQYGQVRQNKNDITMVYGGEDVSRRLTLSPHSIIS